ncbi:H-type lectin domain-containing protein [Archangium violaceum]|uniref:H-type lectin domain-containing protein n=1 Tax=Archangium violaceum TaxID=83451 RepID=UPI00193BC5B9|nr:H-type lectin domain-containing protein [Archangium violaceum]QRK12097.1 H-type lectin domain-containing protein [Archangium violaceum]
MALPLPARAQTSPRAVSIRIQCELRDVSQTSATSIRDCQSLFGWFEGRLDWRSGGTVGDDSSGTLLYSEIGRFYATHSFDGEVLVYADGNDVSEDFQQRYLTPSEHNVLTAPDVRVVLYAHKRGDYVLLTDQRFMPVASAAWARYAEEAMRFSGELRGDVTGPQEGTRVVGLQNVPVSELAPAPGQQLRFDGSQWAPTSPSPLTAGTGLQGGSYDGLSPATFEVVFGKGPGTVTEGSDVRLPPLPDGEGQLLYSHDGHWTALAPGAPTQVLHGGDTPSWGPVALESDVSGVLPAANGGTGLDSPGAAGNVLRSTGTGWASGPLTGSDMPGGSGHYIQNQDGAPQDARMSISGKASVGALQVGGGTTFQRVQMGTFVLNPPGRCGGYPVVKCNYTYSFWFPMAFSSPPTVLASPRSECWDCSDTFNVTVRSVTNRGFNVVVTRTDPSRAGGDWGQSLRIDFLAGN